MKKKKTSLCIVLFVAFVLLLLITGVCTGILCAYLSDVNLNEDALKRKTTLEVVNRDGQVINKSYEYVDIDSLPTILLDAFIAVEDKRFYEHNGLDYKRIIGAGLYDIKHRTLSQGASTITCQLVKNTQLTNEKTFERKVKEAKLALNLEKKYSKNEIIEMYLNAIYFGNGIYGIANACDFFFGKEPRDLSLAQCASLSAIVANPKKYSPTLNAENNVLRRNMVLKLMVEQNRISNEEYQQACSEKLSLTTSSISDNEAYVLQAIYEASNILNLSVNSIKSSGYTIYTYNSNKEQQFLSSNVTDELIARKNNSSLAEYTVMIANPINGEIIAYISNHDYNTMNLKRQPGSTIKPLIYAKAMLDRKLLPASQLLDEKTNFGEYSPSNYNDNYMGYISVRDALCYSSNICAVKTMNIVGVENSINFLNSLGFELGENDKNLALALGGLSKGVTLRTMLSSYGMFANGGNLIEHSFVDKITDDSGKIVYQRKASSQKILDSDTTSYINDCLLATTQKGTAKKLSSFASLAGKTGTVEVKKGNSDCWCIAYNGEYSILSWQGNLSMKEEEMLNATGSYATLVVRNSIENRSYREVPITKEKTAIDKLSLERDKVIRIPSSNTPERFILYDFAEGVSELSPYFEKPSAQFTATLEEDSLMILLTAYKECEYEIRLENITNEYDLQYAIIKEKEGNVSLSFRLCKGIYLLSITPKTHGLTTIRGDTSTKTYYVI